MTFWELQKHFILFASFSVQKEWPKSILDVEALQLPQGDLQAHSGKEIETGTLYLLDVVSRVRAPDFPVIKTRKSI